MRRVVVTGLGMVTPLASGVDETWKRLLAGESGAAPITRFHAKDVVSQHASATPFHDGTRLIGQAPLRCARRREGGARPEARAAQSILIPVCSGDQFRFLKRQLSLPVSMMSQ